MNKQFILRALPALFLTGSFLAIGVSSHAQVEGGGKGVLPVNTDSTFEVHGVEVDVAASSAENARMDGWRVAQRLGWKKLWAKMHGSEAGAPSLSDGALDGIVSGIIVENEQIGPNRYVARLGVMFDRARAGQILGVAGSIRRSAPMLVIPVMWEGGVPKSFEKQTEWQKAWARFNTSESSIDYIRPHGTGADTLLLNGMQAGRGERRWWRVVLDQYGAADVVMPEVRITRQWPGGPISARFIAKFGPDATTLGYFDLQSDNPEALPQILDRGVRRLNDLYITALNRGLLVPDRTLIIEDPEAVEELAPEDQKLVPGAETVELPDSEGTPGGLLPGQDPLTPGTGAGPLPAQTFTVQVATPDAGSVTQAESSLRGVPGVSGASTSSVAVGGTSVMSVRYSGDLDSLAAGLRAQGWRVTQGAGAIRISRPGASSGATPPPPAPPADRNKERDKDRDKDRNRDRDGSTPGNSTGTEPSN